MGYDLRRLARKGLICPVPGKLGYSLTPYGRRVALFVTKVQARRRFRRRATHARRRGVSRGHEDQQQPRARQNVVFELGAFAALLKRERVCVLLKGEVERPSDIDGLVYTRMDRAGAWMSELVRELKAAGIEVDANRLYG
jgi:Predicted nucleotide-binding protein containing TIR-like domain